MYEKAKIEELVFTNTDHTSCTINNVYIIHREVVDNFTFVIAATDDISNYPDEALVEDWLEFPRWICSRNENGDQLIIINSLAYREGIDFVEGIFQRVFVALKLQRLERLQGVKFDNETLAITTCGTLMKTMGKEKYLRVLRRMYDVHIDVRDELEIAEDYGD